MPEPPPKALTPDPIAVLDALLHAAHLIAEHGGDDPHLRAVGGALEDAALSFGQTDPLAQLGLRGNRGGVRPWRVVAIAQRDQLLRRLYQEYFPDLGPTAAARLIHAAWTRASTPPEAPESKASLLHSLFVVEDTPCSVRTIISVLTKQ